MTIALALFGFIRKIPAWVWVVILAALILLYGWARLQAHLRDDQRVRTALAVATGQLEQDTARLRADAASFQTWKSYAARIEATRLEARGQDAGALGRAATFSNAQAAQAYRLGRASCGDLHAPQPTSGPGGPVAPGGVRNDDDLANTWGAAAFTPAH